ncbi:MAG: dipicolinate synthase subunit B [Clostridia bacterium]|nr:dipicolinate synthase subunit B [Clostridia bacterium]
METLKVGYCLTGSYCTFRKSLTALADLLEKGFEVYPMMSENAYHTDTRFGKAKDFVATIEQMTGKKVLSTISEVEPIGPKKYIDVMVLSPCTGNTLSKLANGITDTAATMATKASLRNGIPVVIALATNDGLGQSAKSLGMLMPVKNVYFVPLAQDDPIKKPTSLVCDFTKVTETVLAAAEGKQVEPVIF